jgi:hypothetical protein
VANWLRRDPAQYDQLLIQRAVASLWRTFSSLHDDTRRLFVEALYFRSFSGREIPEQICFELAVKRAVLAVEKELLVRLFIPFRRLVSDDPALLRHAHAMPGQDPELRPFKRYLLEPGYTLGIGPIFKILSLRSRDPIIEAFERFRNSRGQSKMLLERNSRLVRLRNLEAHLLKKDATPRIFSGGDAQEALDLCKYFLTDLVRIPAKPIADSNLMAIRIPIHADHCRSEATLGCFYHRELIGIRQSICI